MHVLLGIGGTDDSYRALERVVERTRSTGDDLTVAVLENPASDDAPDEVERRVRTVVEDAGLEDAVSITQLDGDPGPRLVEFAEGGEFDRLALGGGQRSPMGKISLGGIAEHVLLNARITVTLVR